MHELTATELDQVSGAGGTGVRIGSDGANNIVGNTAVTPLGGRIDPGGAAQPLGGRVDPGGANN
jgi:hypothetical protein